MAAPAPAVSREEFEAIFPGLVKDVTDHVKTYDLPEDALKWFETVRPSLKQYTHLLISPLWSPIT